MEETTAKFITNLISQVVQNNHAEVARQLRLAPDDSRLTIRSHAYLTVGLKNSVTKRNWKMFLVFLDRARQLDTKLAPADFEELRKADDQMMMIPPLLVGTSSNTGSVSRLLYDDLDSIDKMAATLWLTEQVNAKPPSSEVSTTLVCSTLILQTRQNVRLLLNPNNPNNNLDYSWNTAFTSKAVFFLLVLQRIANHHNLPDDLTRSISNFLLPGLLNNAIQQTLEDVFEDITRDPATDSA